MTTGRQRVLLLLSLALALFVVGPAAGSPLLSDPESAANNTEVVVDAQSRAAEGEVEVLQDPSVKPVSAKAKQLDSALLFLRRYNLLLLFPVLIVGIILVRAAQPERWPPQASRALDIAIVVVAAVMASLSLGLCVLRLVHLGNWDFPIFYMVGRAAIEGLSFYDPEVLADVYQRVLEETPVPDLWLKKNVGYWYTPPSALLLAPIGLFTYRWALLLHYVVQLIFLMASIGLLHRFAPISPGRIGLAEATVLFFCFRPVASVINNAQITFGALLFLVLAVSKLEKQPRLAGIFLGLGFLYKHLLLIPAAFGPIIRRTAMAWTCGITIFASLVVSLLVFGKDRCLMFLQFGASARPPELAIDNSVNSLLSTVIRLSGSDPPSGGLLNLLTYPPFVVCGALLTIATIVICLGGGWTVERRRLKFSLISALALIAYPNTLYNTLPLILPVFFILFSSRSWLTIPGTWLAVFIALQYGLVFVKPQAFWMLLATWAMLAVLLGIDAARLRAQERRPTGS